ncbi:MAG: hypothetical protein AAB423_04105 [Patescibacteria group bacterium]
MSEKINFGYETDDSNNKSQEKSHSKEVNHDSSESLPKKASKETLDELLKSAQEKAKTSKEIEEKSSGDSKKTNSNIRMIGNDLSNNSFKQIIKKTQKKLPFDQKILSKFVHRPTVDTISEISSKTVARPVGLAMGGAFSLFSSLLVLWASYFFGYEYNFMIGIMSFVGGFIIGTILEILLKLVFRRKSAY